jgi:hypothetical protein
MEPPVAICKSIEEYRRIRETTSDPAFKDVQGSLEKSLQCGCEYCSLTCRLVDKGDELDRNKERNQEAFVENSELSFSAGKKTAVSKDVILKGEFNGSGFRFKGETLFIEGKDINSLALQGLMTQYFQYQHQYLGTLVRTKLFGLHGSGLSNA